MRNLVVTVFLLAVAAVPVLAQDDDDYQPSPFSFQGRVGALFAGEDPFKDGASFEIGMMYRVFSNVHLSISGGTSNFEGGTEPAALSEDFALFIDDVQKDFAIVNPDEARYRINFGTFGAAFKLGRGRFEPYAIGGIGIYQVRFVYTFDYQSLLVPIDTGVTSVQDQKYMFGWFAGGGLNYSINNIIGFGTQITYHSLDTDAIDEQIMATFGLNVTIP